MGEKMRKHNLVLFYGCFCSLLFALFYYLIFASLYHPFLHIDYLQVGIYEQAASLQKCQDRFKKLEVPTYTIKKDKKIYVVCGFEQYDAIKEILTNEGIRFVEKSLTIKNEEHRTLWEQKAYQDVLERMYGDESKGNDGG